MRMRKYGNKYTNEELLQMMKDEQIRLIGYDGGYGNGKAAEVRFASDGPAIKTVAILSNVGLALERQTGQMLGEFFSRNGTEEPRRVAFEGLEYVVGENAHMYSNAIVDRFDFERFDDSQEMKALTYTSWYELLGAGHHRVAIAMALPLEAVKTREEADDRENAIRRWLIGQHEFAVDGEQASIEVINVRAKMSQPLAAWFGWAMDFNGASAHGDDDLRAPCWVADLGYNTFDLLYLQNGKPSDFSRGERLGTRRASEEMGDHLVRKYGAAPDRKVLDVAVRDYLVGNKATTYIRGKKTDVSEDARLVINNVLNRATTYFETAAKGADSARILCVGGAAVPLASRLLRNYPQTHVPGDPLFAIAKGLAKVARRPGFLLPAPRG